MWCVATMIPELNRATNTGRHRWLKVQFCHQPAVPGSVESEGLTSHPPAWKVHSAQGTGLNEERSGHVPSALGTEQSPLSRLARLGHAEWVSHRVPATQSLLSHPPAQVSHCHLHPPYTLTPAHTPTQPNAHTCSHVHLHVHTGSLAPVAPHACSHPHTHTRFLIPTPTLIPALTHPLTCALHAHTCPLTLAHAHTHPSLTPALHAHTLSPPPVPPHNPPTLTPPYLLTLPAHTHTHPNAHT